MKKVLLLISLMVYFFLVPRPVFSEESKVENKAAEQKKVTGQNQDEDDQEIENRPVTFIGTLTRDTKRASGGNGIVVHLTQNSKGDIYAVKLHPAEVAVYNKEGKFLFSFGKEGNDVGKFIQPFSIAIDKQDMVFVCDVSRKKILVFTPLGEFMEEFSSGSAVAKDDKYQNTTPGCIAIDKKNDRLYISDASNGHIWIHDLNGKFLQYFKGKEQGAFCTPGIVCFDKKNQVYVPEGMCDRVRVFKQDGTELFQVGGKSGDQAGQFSRLTGVAIDSFGRVYVTDLLLRCVQVFSSDGKFLGAIKWLSDKEDKTYIKMPTGVFVGHDDHIFITDQDKNQVYIIKDNKSK